jgi:DegV family protein with EDD domain
MNITLVTDSTCDLKAETMHDRNIVFAPLKVLFKAEEFIDKIDLSNKDFYEKMKTASELPTTSQVNPNEFYDLFSEALSKGHKVIGLFISSELSGTYNSACIAKEMLGSDDIYLIDSRTASFALGLMVLRVKDMIDAGMPVETIVTQTQELIISSQLYGMLDTLENLKKGGRLSSSAAMIGKMLNLKPIIEVLEGVVNVAFKARGARKGTVWMLDQLEKDYPSLEIKDLAIAHANAYDKLEEMKSELLKRFKIERIHEMEVGSVIGTHTGEGVIGIAYFK